MSDPIDPKVAEPMNHIAESLDRFFKLVGNYGFALLVFDMSKIEGGRMNWISNAQREDMITALREQLAYFEGATPPSTDTKH